MLLSSSNSLTLYNTNGATGIVLNPNSGGGVTFPDGTTLLSANSLNNGSSILWNLNANHGLSLTATSFSLGNTATATGLNSFAMGSSANASGASATAFGNSATASGSNSFAMGSSANASGFSSAAFGNSAIASGSNSVAIGSSANASGASATAFGASNTASGASAAAYGFHTVAASFASVAYGEYNVGLVNSGSGGAIGWVSSDPEIEVGNGSSAAPSDSFVLLKTGELRTAGLVQSQIGFMTPPTGDLNMGTFTNGLSPTNMVQATGLKYPNGQ